MMVIEYHIKERIVDAAFLPIFTKNTELFPRCIMSLSPGIFDKSLVFNINF